MAVLARVFVHCERDDAKGLDVAYSRVSLVVSAQLLLAVTAVEGTMNRLLRMTTIVACAVIFLGTWSTIAAQGQKKAKKSSGAVTISGCLRRGPDANSYVLANVAGGPYELIGAPAS